MSRNGAVFQKGVYLLPCEKIRGKKVEKYIGKGIYRQVLCTDFREYLRALRYIVCLAYLYRNA